MKTIRGIEIDELEDLSYNLQRIRSLLKERTSFWYTYNKVIEKQGKGKQSSKAGFFFKVLLFIILLPKYISISLNRSRLQNEIEQAEIELMTYYDQPITKVRRFRLKCANAKSIYKNELKIIDEETDALGRNLEAKAIGIETKKEINDLIEEFELRRYKKQNKYDFYSKCEEKLLDIEEQIQVKQSIEESRRRLNLIEEIQVETSKQKEIEEEFELFEHYGNLLDSISTNLRKLEQDKEERIEEEEMLKMLTSMGIKN